MLNNKMNKKAQAATGMIIFISIVLIVFLFLVFNILTSAIPFATKDRVDITVENSKLDQTLTTLIKTSGIDNLIIESIKQEKCLPKLEKEVREILNSVYVNKEVWIFKLYKEGDLLNICNFNQELSLDNAPKKLFSKLPFTSPINTEQILPYPEEQGISLIIVRLDKYE